MIHLRTFTDARLLGLLESYGQGNSEGYNVRFIADICNELVSRGINFAQRKITIDLVETT